LCVLVVAFQSASASKLRPIPCCLPNGLIVKDVTEVRSTGDATQLDSEYITFTLYEHDSFVEIRLYESPTSAEMLIFNVRSDQRSVSELQLADGVWCKTADRDRTENMANITTFDLFLTGCSDGDAAKFSGWDDAGNEKYQIRTSTPTSAETSILYLERINRKHCKPAKFDYTQERYADDSVVTMMGRSTFTVADTDDLSLISKIVAAEQCAK